jgi:hypothetical protein
MKGPTNATRFERLLRWYPCAWRVRYGDELVALMEETYGDDGVPVSGRLGIARAGVVERLREMRFGGGGLAPVERLRAGSSLVLCAWAFFVVGGAIFVKFAEHWDVATPKGARWLPTAAYDTVQWVAALGAGVIALAAATALPAFVRLLRAGRWGEVRRPIRRAAVVTAVAALMSVGVIVWAHHLGPAQRNGGSGPYAVVGLVWGLLMVATVATDTVASLHVVGRLNLSLAVWRLEGLLALVLTLAMAAIIGGTVAWWAAVATNAPWFLSGAPSGSGGSSAPPALVIAGLCMLAGLSVAVGGAGRVARAVRAVN